MEAHKPSPWPFSPNEYSIATSAGFTFISMRKTFFATLLLTALPHVSGQTFTAHIRATEGGKGRVTIVQSERIEALVNGLPREEKTEAPTKPAAPAPTTRNEAAEAAKTARTATGYNAGTRQRYKAKGFRIQIFTGGNSRADKDNAAQAGRKVKAVFPELSVYTHFVSPRWVCRVGDFRSREDAEKYVSLIRRSGFTQECHIVVCTVLLAR